MRSLALLLIFINFSFLSWQLSWLPGQSWLPWQPSQFGPSLSPATPPAFHLPRLILVSEQNAAQSITSSSSVKTNHPVEKPKNGAKTATSSTVETANSKMVNVKGESVAGVAEQTSHMPIAPVLTQESVSEKKSVANSDHLDSEEPSNSQQIVESVTSLNTSVELTPLASTVAAVVPVSDKTPVTASDKRPTPDKAASQEEKEMVTKPEAKVTKAEKSPSAKIMCLRIGPYKEADVAKNAADWFNQKYVGSAKIQNRHDDKEVLHTRVYLLFANKTAAQQAQQRLLQLGIKEYTLLPDNTISLGVYRDPVNAEQRLAGLKDKGFTNVKMEKQYKNGTQHWLSVKIPVDQNEWLNGFKKNFKGTTVETVACEKLP